MSKLIKNWSYLLVSDVIQQMVGFFDGGLTATLSRELARRDVCKEDKYQIFKTLESSYFVVVALSILIVVSLSSVISEKWLN